MSSNGKPKCYNFIIMPSQEFNELSERELDILKLVATGASNKEIAQKLFISSNTVKVHLRNIFTKIGATSRTEAAMYAVRSGITETISPQLIENPDLVAAQNPVVVLQKSDSWPKLFKNRFTARNLSLLALFIILLITGILYLRRNDILVSTTTPPTATQRVQWIQLPGLPTPRSGLAVVTYENKVYAIGGENPQGISDLVESYDPQTSLWAELSTKPTPVTDIKAAVIGGRIFIPGGRLATGLVTDILEIFDPQTNQWSEGKSLPKPLSAYVLAVFEGQMYLFGGWDGSAVVNDAYMYDYHNNTWSSIPPMPTARAYAGSVVIGGKIYIIGGWDGNQAIKADEAFVPDNSGASQQWVQEPSLPYGRYAMGITNLADIIFIIGGLGGSDNPSTIALSPGDTYWGELQSPIKTGWSNLGVSTIGTRLFALGGKNGETMNTEMWEYQAIFTITFPIIR